MCGVWFTILMENSKAKIVLGQYWTKSGLRKTPDDTWLEQNPNFGHRFFYGSVRYYDEYYIVASLNFMQKMQYKKGIFQIMLVWGFLLLFVMTIKEGVERVVLRLSWNYSSDSRQLDRSIHYKLPLHNSLSLQQTIFFFSHNVTARSKFLVIANTPFPFVRMVRQRAIAFRCKLLNGQQSYNCPS